jgi:hypothetical protein
MWISHVAPPGVIFVTMTLPSQQEARNINNHCDLRVDLMN